MKLILLVIVFCLGMFFNSWLGDKGRLAQVEEGDWIEIGDNFYHCEKKKEIKEESAVDLMNKKVVEYLKLIN